MTATRGRASLLIVSHCYTRTYATGKGNGGPGVPVRVSNTPRFRRKPHASAWGSDDIRKCVSATVRLAPVPVSRLRGPAEA
jgi:hypothetical protein